MIGAGWGDNITGQLAGGYRSSQQKTPVTSVVLGDADQYAAAYGTAYAVQAGKLLVAGENIYGQFGDGTRTTARTQPGIVPLDRPVRQIAPAGAHWLALLDDGSLATCGGNSFGTLGNGTSGKGMEINGSALPVYLTGLPPMVAVEAGGGCCAAIDGQGRLWMWGENKRGEIGNGSKVEQLVPTLVPIPEGVKAVSVGGVGGEGAHTLALLGDGTVLAWGNNNHGQLGDGTLVNKSLPTLVRGLANVVAVSAGPGHSLALLADGSVVGWGANAVGELGSEPLTKANPHPRAIPLPGPAQAISAGFRYSVFLVGGQAYVCGWNDHGTLGDPAAGEWRAQAGLVAGLVGVHSLCAGDFEVIVGAQGAAPPPISVSPGLGALNVAWAPGMAHKIAWRAAQTHDAWQGVADVSRASGYQMPLPSGQRFEIEVTGGTLGQLVVEGVPA